MERESIVTRFESRDDPIKRYTRVSSTMCGRFGETRG
jgi:hypothetical protein